MVQCIANFHTLSNIRKIKIAQKCLLQSHIQGIFTNSSWTCLSKLKTYPKKVSILCITSNIHYYKIMQIAQDLSLDHRMAEYLQILEGTL